MTAALRAFEAVAKHASFTAAAHALAEIIAGAGQPAIGVLRVRPLGVNVSDRVRHRLGHFVMVGHHDVNAS